MTSAVLDTPPWATTAETGRAALRGGRRCLVAIIGAGITGLATAIQVLELDPGADVVVLEAGHVGSGASGHGTGLLGTRIGPSLDATRSRYGDDVARAGYLWSEAAVEHVVDLVSRYRIECDLRIGSQLIVARDEKALTELRRDAAIALELGLPIDYVPQIALPPWARAYRAGLRFRQAATMDPAAFVAGLATVAEQLGATILENSAVLRLDLGRQAMLTTRGGFVFADCVVVAVNAFHEPLRLPRGVVGLTVQAGATAPLPATVLDTIAGLGDEPLLEHGTLRPYYRLDARGRLIVGGRAVRRGVRTAAALAPIALLEAVRGLAPALSDVGLEHAWSGPIGMTRDGYPVLGRYPGTTPVYYAGGCCGHGLAVSTYNGSALGRRIVSRDHDDICLGLPWGRPAGPRMPTGALGDALFDGYLAYLSRKSGG